MPALNTPIPEWTKSFLISGGLKKDGKSFILDKKKELLKIKREGKYHFNSHVGFVDEKEIDELAKIVDYVSFDFVSDAEVIKKVYKLDRNVQQYIALYKRLSAKIKTYPHITIGLDGGKIHWEYGAIDILKSLGVDRLVLNVLIPTPGTEFANVKNPDFGEVKKIFQYARKVFKDGILILGCMRPWGNYRAELDMMAVEEGADRIVQPTVNARLKAEKMGLKISYLYECCALDTPSYDERIAPQKKETCRCSSGDNQIDRKMRLSTGSASILDLKKIKTRSKNKTIYLMNSGGCEYSCSFCAQGKNATSTQDKLSRVTWPEYETKEILKALSQKK